MNHNVFIAHICIVRVTPYPYVQYHAHHNYTCNLFAYKYHDQLKGHCIEFKYYADGIHTFKGERWPSGLGRRPATGRSMVRVPLR